MTQFQRGNDISDDIEKFVRLVLRATVEQNFDIITNCVNYLKSNPTILQRPIKYYAENIQQDLVEWEDVKAEEGWSEETKPYWEHLANALTLQS